MEGGVDEASAHPQRPVGLHRPRAATSRAPAGEGHDEGVAARGRGGVAEAKSSAMTIPGPDAWATVHVAVDAAAAPQSPLASISRAAPFHALRDGDDAAVADADVGADHVGGRHHRAAAKWRDRAVSFIVASRSGELEGDVLGALPEGPAPELGEAVVAAGDGDEVIAGELPAMLGEAHGGRRR